MLYTVAIAVCLSATPVHKCQRLTSVVWIIAPERPASIAGCMRHGMLYAAESHLVDEGSYAKVFCSTRSAPGRNTAQAD
jgi:hypothetical protein